MVQTVFWSIYGLCWRYHRVRSVWNVAWFLRNFIQLRFNGPIIFPKCLIIPNKFSVYTGWHKKREIVKNPTQNWRNKKKLLTEIEPLQLAFYETVIQIINVWKLRPVDGVLQNATLSHSAEHITHTGWHKKRELLKCVVAVKESIRGGGRHLQDVIFEHW